MNKEQLFERFITQNLNNAYRFAYIYVNDPQTAEDIVSDSVVKALKSIRQLKNPVVLKTWFYTIISNTARTYLRQNNKVVYMDDEMLEKQIGAVETNSSVYFESIIQNLPPDLKTILVLRFFEEMKFREIARILNTNENTIKTKFYRALKILKLEMEGECHESKIRKTQAGI